MKYVEVLKDCRSLNAADEMNCPMPRSVEKVPVRNEKRCNTALTTGDKLILDCFVLTTYFPHFYSGVDSTETTNTSIFCICEKKS